jgi:hypothetical protein
VLGESMGPPEEEAERADDDEPATRPVPEELRAAVSGSFYSPELDATYTLSPGENGSVRVSAPPGLEVDLRLSAPDTLRGGFLTLRLERAADGAVRGFQVDAGRVQNLRFERRP